MKRLLLCLLLAGCTVQVKPSDDALKRIDEHSMLLNMIVAYVQDLQAKGVLPLPEVKKEEVKK